MKKYNTIREKSYRFSLEIIQVCKDLKISREFELSKQLLKSGTSIGANVSIVIRTTSAGTNKIDKLINPPYFLAQLSYLPLVWQPKKHYKDL